MIAIALPCMPKVTFIAHDGATRTVHVAAGTTLMRAATDNGVTGIDGDCGGNCACATCHVYVDPAWFDRVGVRSGGMPLRWRKVRLLLNGSIERRPQPGVALNNGSSRYTCRTLDRR
jgi:hypothetical protein